MIMKSEVSTDVDPEVLAQCAVVPLVSLPTLGDSPGALSANPFELPCDHESSRAWASAGFVTQHTLNLLKVCVPCYICGYQLSPVLIDENGDQWMPHESDVRGRRYDTFSVAALYAEKIADRLEAVYVGRLA